MMIENNPVLKNLVKMFIFLVLASLFVKIIFF